MKLYKRRIRNQLGVLEDVEMVDIDGIIAIAAEIWRQQPDDENCIAFFRWLNELGHKPTGREFVKWIETIGFKPVLMEDETHEN